MATKRKTPAQRFTAARKRLRNAENKAKKGGAVDVGNLAGLDKAIKGLAAGSSALKKGKAGGAQIRATRATAKTLRGGTVRKKAGTAKNGTPKKKK